MFVDQILVQDAPIIMNALPMVNAKVICVYFHVMMTMSVLKMKNVTRCPIIRDKLGNKEFVQ